MVNEQMKENEEENVDGEKVCTTEEKLLSFQLFTYQNDIF
jgi:hypothetical protein